MNFLRKEMEEKEEMDYHWVWEYTFEVKNGSDFNDYYALTMGEDKIHYNPIPTRVSLLKYKVIFSNIFNCTFCFHFIMFITGCIQVSPFWAHQFILHGMVPHVITAVTAKFQMIAPKKGNLNSTSNTCYF